jgi:spore maturation protein CgeB
VYSPAQIKRGIKNPEMVRAELSDYYNRFRYKLINERVSNKGKNSNIALAINWGCHELNHWPVAEYKFFIEKFIDRYDPLIVPNQKTYDKFGNLANIIVTIEPSSYMSPELDYENSREQEILLITGHPHPKGESFERYISKNDIDYILSRYYDPMKMHFPDIPEEKIVHYPWAVPKEHIIDRDEISMKNQEKIAIFGKKSDHPMYEARNRLRGSQFVSNVRSIKSSKNDSKPLTDEEYYRWIREFDAAIAAGSFQPEYQYTLAKYFEIPAAGSLLFAQYCSDLGRLGFDEKNCVIFEDFDDFEGKADTYLENPGEYMERRKRGVELIRDRHTIEDRIDRISSLCDGFD